MAFIYPTVETLRIDTMLREKDTAVLQFAGIHMLYVTTGWTGEDPRERQ